jgi:release factor glutamine methyltransferase
MARSVRIITLPGVFQPHSDARLLAAAMRERGLAVGARVLEVFAGSGAIAVAAAREGACEVTVVDVSRRALLSAWINARRNGAHLRIRRGDLFAPVAGERFDLILANPPYVPGPPPPARGRARATDAGADGRALLDRICADAAQHLTPGGALLVVHSEVCGEGATLDALTRTGLEADVVRRDRGPLGPLLRARRPELEARGLLAPGQDLEDVMVVRGRLIPASASTRDRWWSSGAGWGRTVTGSGPVAHDRSPGGSRR